MRFIDYRIKRAAITAAYRAQLAELDKEYADFDRAAQNAERAAKARSGRIAKSVTRDAADWIKSIEPFLSRYVSGSILPTAPGLEAMYKAVCELDSRFVTDGSVLRVA